METKELEELISRRPKAYSWFGFQRFLLYIFLILGIIFFFNAVYIAAYGLMKYILIDEASHKIATRYHVNKAEVQNLLIKYLDPIKYKAILYSFFLSLSFFIISRYCQKTINRNRYILKLEQEWKKVNNPQT